MLVSARFARALMIGTGLLGIAGCSANWVPPPDGLIDYFTAKQNFAHDIQIAFGSDPKSANYRLVAVAGPSYPVGALIAADDNLDLESRACQPDPEDLPARELWGSMPGWSSNKRLGLTLAIPAPMKQLFAKAQSSLGAGITLDSTGSFAVTGLEQVFLSRADMRTVLARPECQAALAASQGGKAVFVRGVVYGQESMQSTRSFDANLGVKIIEDESGAIGLTYHNNGGFTLNETEPRPKFMIVASVESSPAQIAQRPPNKGPKPDPIDAIFGLPSDAQLLRVSQPPKN